MPSNRHTSLIGARTIEGEAPLVGFHKADLFAGQSFVEAYVFQRRTMPGGLTRLGCATP